VDLAAVTRLRVEVYTTLGQSDRAVEVCLAYLRHLGIAWSPHPSDHDVRQALERMWKTIGSRPIEALIDLPLMTEPDWHATTDVLAGFLSPALFTDRHLFALALVSMVHLSLEHGNGYGSCLAYAQLIRVLGPHCGDYWAGFRFGQLGLALVEQRGLTRFKARVYLVVGHHVMPWARPLHTGRALVRRVFEAAQDTGDLTFATYSATLLITNLLASGAPLGEVQQEAEHGLAFARQARFAAVVDCFMAQLSLIRTLRGLAPDRASGPEAGPDEGWLDQHLQEDTQLTTW
jgi:predicted ATPase